MVSFLPVLQLLLGLLTLNLASSVEEFTFHCPSLESKLPHASTVRYATKSNLPIAIHVSKRVTHQITSRIAAIYLKQILGYQRVSLVPYAEDLYHDASSRRKSITHITALTNSERDAHDRPDFWPELTFDIEAYVPPDRLVSLHEDLFDAGPTVPQVGVRYGVFVPERFHQRTLLYQDLQENSQVLDQFVPPTEFLNQLKEKSFKSVETSACKRSTSCPLILSSKYEDTQFFIPFAEQLKLKVRVLWLEDDLWKILGRLLKNENQRFTPLVLHWTPSEIIDSSEKFRSVIFPMCREMDLESTDASCLFDTTSFRKFAIKAALELPALKYFLNNFEIEYSDYKEVLEDFQRRSDGNLDEVACRWLGKHIGKASEWRAKERKIELKLGIFLPNDERTVVLNATIVKAKQDANSVLQQVDLDFYNQYDDCQSESSLSSAQNFAEEVIGILGPPCKNSLRTVIDQVRDVSVPIVSYIPDAFTAEDVKNSSFHFFEVLGGKQNHEKDYLDVIQRFGWERVAMLSEYGRPGTDYLSGLKDQLTRNGVEVLDQTFSRYKRDFEDRLKEIYDFPAKVIIADVPEEVLPEIMLSALKHEMTYENDYVWILPMWFQNWTQSNPELAEAFNGTIYLTYKPFEDSKNIQNWSNSILSMASRSESRSNFKHSSAGFIYDAFWIYGKALETIENDYPQALAEYNQTHNLKAKLIEILESKIDFEGVSGRIQLRSRDDSTRKAILLQWRDGQYHETIKWRHKMTPKDGVYCELLFFSMRCRKVTTHLIPVICVSLLVLFSIGFFLYWRQNYKKRRTIRDALLHRFGFSILEEKMIEEIQKCIIPDGIWIDQDRKLGSGNFSVVYRGVVTKKSLRNRFQTDQIAAKKLKNHPLLDYRKDFLLEAMKLTKIQHENIVRCYGIFIGDAKNQPSTILELMSGGDLRHYLESERGLLFAEISEDSTISPRRLTSIALDVAKALEYLAKVRLIHRDLAARNVFLNDKGQAKLGDFGLIRSLGHSSFYAANPDAPIPIRWQAYEVVVSKEFSLASDMWSFGCLLYEIITVGDLPYSHIPQSNEAEVMKLISKKCLFDLPLCITPEIEFFIRSCLRFNAESRITASQAVHTLQSNPTLLSACVDKISLIHSRKWHDQLLGSSSELIGNINLDDLSSTPPDTKTFLINDQDGDSGFDNCSNDYSSRLSTRTNSASSRSKNDSVSEPLLEQDETPKETSLYLAMTGTRIVEEETPLTGDTR